MFTAPVLWFAAMVLLFALEMMVPVGAFLFFGVGCLAGWLSALFNLSVNAQILFAVLSCVVSLLVFRERLKLVFSGRSTKDADVDDDAFAGIEHLKGETGKTVGELKKGVEGQIEIQGSFWRALSPECDLPAGTPVRVTGRTKDDALLLEVRRAGS